MEAYPGNAHDVLCFKASLRTIRRHVADLRKAGALDPVQPNQHPIAKTEPFKVKDKSYLYRENRSTPLEPVH